MTKEQFLEKVKKSTENFKEATRLLSEIKCMAEEIDNASNQGYGISEDEWNSNIEEIMEEFEIAADEFDKLVMGEIANV